MIQTSAIILAAGDSGRMGTPKLSLMYSEGVSFVEQCVTQFLLFGCCKVVVVINHGGRKWIEQQKPPLLGNLLVANNSSTQTDKHLHIQPGGKIVMVDNAHPERGRFYSLQQGLLHIGKEHVVFVHNVDNPFISQGTLQTIYQASQHDEGFAWISPRYNGRGGHPILLSARLAKAIRHEMTVDVNLKEYLSHEERTAVDLNDPGILKNINSMEDYQASGLPMT